MSHLTHMFTTHQAKFVLMCSCGLFPEFLNSDRITQTQTLASKMEKKQDTQFDLTFNSHTVLLVNDSAITAANNSHLLSA